MNDNAPPPYAKWWLFTLLLGVVPLVLAPEIAGLVGGFWIAWLLIFGKFLFLGFVWWASEIYSEVKKLRIDLARLRNRYERETGKRITDL